MWGCDYIPFLNGNSWNGGLISGSIFYLLIWGVVILLFVYAAARIFKTVAEDKSARHRDRTDSLAILKVRYAKGEISSEEFNKMKQVLSQS
jgi:putative membrane protein